MKGYPGWLAGETKDVDDRKAKKMLVNFPSSFVCMDEPKLVLPSNDTIDEATKDATYNTIEKYSLVLLDKDGKKIEDIKKLNVDPLKKAVKEALNKMMAEYNNKSM